MITPDERARLFLASMEGFAGHPREARPEHPPFKEWGPDYEEHVWRTRIAQVIREAEADCAAELQRVGELLLAALELIEPEHVTKLGLTATRDGRVVFKREAGPAAMAMERADLIEAMMCAGMEWDPPACKPEQATAHRYLDGWRDVFRRALDVAEGQLRGEAERHRAESERHRAESERHRAVAEKLAMRLSPLEALALRAGITGEDFDRLDAVMADVGRGMRNEWKPQYADCEFPNCECPWPFEDHCRHKPMEEPT